MTQPGQVAAAQADERIQFRFAVCILDRCGSVERSTTSLL